MNDFERMSSAKAGGGSAMALFLGLFLLVLAFFILLVSISTIENVKSKEVMNSLTSTFADLVTPVTDPTDFVSMQGEILAPEAFQERISGVFSTSVAVDRIKVIQPGRVMRIDLQALELFEDGKAVVRPGHTEMIERIVASLNANPKNVRFELAFLIGSTVSETAELPTSQTLEMSRAGSFARLLIEQGAPPNSISVGVHEGAPSGITIHFYARDEQLARLNFEKDIPAEDLNYDDAKPDALPSNIIDLPPLEPQSAPESGEAAP